MKIQVNEAEGTLAGEGYRVWIKGDAFDPGDSKMLNTTTDGQGEARFGPIRPGSYTLHVWDENNVKHQRTIIAYPGQDNDIEVAWRRLDRAFAPLEVGVSLPEVIRDHVTFVWIRFQAKRLEFPPEPGDWEDEYTIFDVLIDPDGGQAHMTGANWPFEESQGMDFEFLEPGWSLTNSQVMCDTTRTFQVQSVKFYFRVPDDGTETERDRFRSFTYGDFTGQRRNNPFLNIEYEYRALSGQENRWKVEIPDMQGQQARSSRSMGSQVERVLREHGIIPQDDSS